VRDGFRFTNAIVWTALAYNPVRIIGLVSLALFAIAGVIGLYTLLLRLSGVTTLNAWQVYALFSAVLVTIAGVSLFSLGAMFNYLVSLFHQTPIRQGLFGKPIFNPPLEHHFGWIGLASIVAGTVFGIGAFIASLNGMDITRLWFYLLAAAFFSIIGIQLFVSWIVMRVLEELSRRESSAQQDLVESEPSNIAMGVAPETRG
jgi:hypothetical protein